MPFGEIYLPLYVGFPRDPKVRALMYEHGQDGVLAAYLYVVMALYCRENLSDGWVPRAEVPALAYPMDRATSEQVVQMLLDARLINVQSKRSDGALYLPAFVPRNGTRQDAVRRSEQRRHAGRSRWAKHDASDVLSDTLSTNGARPEHVRGQSESESESESIDASVGVVDDPRTHAPAHVRDADDRPTDNDDQGDELDSLVQALMFTRTGQSVTRLEAAAIRAEMLSGRNVANPASYLRSALSTKREAVKHQPHHDRRQPPPAAAVLGPRQNRAAEAGRGAAKARQLLAEQAARRAASEAAAAAGDADALAALAPLMAPDDDEEDRYGRPIADVALPDDPDDDDPDDSDDSDDPDYDDEPPF